MGSAKSLDSSSCSSSRSIEGCIQQDDAPSTVDEVVGVARYLQGTGPASHDGISLLKGFRIATTTIWPLSPAHLSSWMCCRYTQLIRKRERRLERHVTMRQVSFVRRFIRPMFQSRRLLATFPQHDEPVLGFLRTTIWI